MNDMKIHMRIKTHHWLDSLKKLKFIWEMYDYPQELGKFIRQFPTYLLLYTHMMCI